MLYYIEGNLCGLSIYLWSSDMHFLPVECDLYFVNILNILGEINILLLK